MNLSKKLCLVLACTLVLFTGCLKKPQRPVPADTIGQGSGLNPNEVPGGMTDASSATLAPRTDGVYEDADMIKGLLKPVYFDFDKSNIRESEREKLKAAKDYIDKNPQYRLLLEGHADWRGTAEYNLGLGDRRANASKSYLGKIGLPATKVETLSKGSLEAKEKGTADEMKNDRRVEIIILKK